jgi:ketosteroid isomerase-like protein
MSQENVEVVRSAYAAINERDFDALATLTALDWVFDFSRSVGPQRGVYRGHGEIARFAASMDEAFERFQLTPIKFVVGAGGRIVSRHRLSAKGRSSGLELERVPDVAVLWEFRDGKIIRATLYQHPSEALEAVGLSE